MEPIRVHPENPHYYLFHGKPTILITSAEHYGAVVNKDFDYVTYLDALVSYGLNYTRIYPGYLIEPEHKFIRDNTLAPRSDALLLPCARSDAPSYALGGCKFDLDTWDAAFFRRLSDFVAQAASRDIVVEVCFFNCQYPDTWVLSPLYCPNNIQGVGPGDHNSAQTLGNAGLARYETAYVRKILRELNPFGNVIFEICDEPILLGTPEVSAGRWIAHMLQTIVDTERDLPNQHLIAQQVEGPLGGACDFSGHPDVSIVVAQYVWEASAQQEGGMQALEKEYEHDKPIELNETYYFPVWYKGDAVASSRVEAWEFIVGGGASFNHLNGCYTVHDPSGRTADNAKVCGALGNLKRFMASLDYVRMRPDKSVRLEGESDKRLCRCISEPGQQYALYLHHSSGARDAAYVVDPGSYVETIEITMPAGTYQSDWIAPATGVVVDSQTLTHGGGTCALTTPVHEIDIALRMRRVGT